MDTGSRRAYCIVPADLAVELYEPLCEHFHGDSGVTVVVEVRRSERRKAERRSAKAASPAHERRRVRSIQGRRVADRRVSDRIIAPRALPAAAQPYVERLCFVERTNPSDEHVRDVKAHRLVIRFQSGESSAFEELYLHYFEPLYTYLGVALRDSHEAQDATQEVLLRAMQALPEYQVRPGLPFRAWLFRIARNHVVNELARSRRTRLEDPAALDRARERVGQQPPETVDWLADTDLAALIARLPPAQRQALMLRFVVGLSGAETAAVLECTPASARQLQHRALAFLKRRLIALGREPSAARLPMRRRSGLQTVVQARRGALDGGAVGVGPR